MQEVREENSEGISFIWIHFSLVTLFIFWKIIFW